MEPRRLSILVKGRVQGVGFRYFVMETAERLDLTGWVRNCFDGSVEMEVQGDQRDLDQFCKEVNEGPALAYVNTFLKNEMPVVDGEKGFKITY